MSKPLDMADKYEPLSYEDDEPTIRVQVPTFLPKVIVSSDANDDPSWDDEDTEVMPAPFKEETRYPGIGLALVVVTGAAFWGALLWWLFA